MKRKLYMTALVVLLVLVGAAWAFGEIAYPRTNPPERYGGPILSPDTDPLLRRACFDCHSNETDYPWYSRLPVASIILGRHVHEGRSTLNFSLWDRMGAEQRREQLGEALEAVQEGEMPLQGYVLLHPRADLSPTELASLERDALRTYGVTAEYEGGEGGEGGGEGHEDDEDDDDEDDDD